MWVELVVFVVMTAISFVLQPKAPKPKAPSVGNVEVPTAEEGIPLPVVFGKVLVQNPNVVWYGDLDYSAIYSSGSGK